MQNFALKGDIVYTKNQDSFSYLENGFIVCKNGFCEGAVGSLCEVPDLIDLTIIDYSGKLIIPCISDLHLHAPQYPFRGMGMDMPLLDWLKTYTFPEEEKYASLEYAAGAYERFVNDLRCSPTGRFVMFSTIHLEASLLLARLLEKSGLGVLLGKTNMDRNSSAGLSENTERSLEDTKIFIEQTASLKNVRPIITPRFVPSCSSRLMQGLGTLAAKYDLPIQSHLSETQAEIDWVRELHPDRGFYAKVYESFGLLNDKTIMAHCVHSPPAEQDLLKKQKTFIAHCPQSNTNLGSGAAPAADYLAQGLNVGLGTDIAGGSNLNMFRAASDAISVSKLRSCLLGSGKRACLSPSQAFYMMTKGGGAFWEKSIGLKTGSFEKGYAFDALVLDDETFSRCSPEKRAERLLYLGDERHVCAKYLNGELIYERP